MSAITTLIGNTTSDIDLRFTQGGRPVGNVTIAVSDRKFDKARNEWVDGDVWFARCTLWGELAEHAAASIRKGTRVIAQGRISQRDFEDREGGKRTAVEVTLEDIGASMRYATATVTRAASNRGGQPAQTDQWASAQPGESDAWSTPTSGEGSYGDDTPF